MSVYKYPTIQTIIRDSLFVMEKDVISNMYESYTIPHMKGGIIKYGAILHTDLSKYLEEKKVIAESKYVFANGARFIRIPLKYLTNVI